MSEQSKRRFSLKLHPYRRSLPKSVSNARSAWKERRGTLLELRLGDGAAGWGESSPLAGYSPDDLEGAEGALGLWASGPEGRRAVRGRLSETADVGTLHELVKLEVSKIPAQLPSARFGLETALLDWAGRRYGLPMPALLCADSEVLWSAVELASLWSEPLNAEAFNAKPSGAEGAAENTSLDTAGPIKIKVGRAGFLEQELQGLRKIREAQPELELRLDANGGWSVEQAQECLARLEPLGIRWIEEPARVTSIAQLNALIETSPVAVALDESLWRLGLDPETVTQLRPAAVILKPQVLGGSLRCLDLARAAASVGAQAVASHTFDGPVAYRATMALAVALDQLSLAVLGRANSGSTEPGSTDPDSADLGSIGHGLTPHIALEAWPEAFLELRECPAARAPGSGLEWTP